MDEEAPGQEAYNVWAKAMAEQDVGVDPWDSLDTEDQHAWAVVESKFSTDYTN